VQVVSSGTLFRAGMLLNSSEPIERLAGVDTIPLDKPGQQGREARILVTMPATSAVTNRRRSPSGHRPRDRRERGATDQFVARRAKTRRETLRETPHPMQWQRHPAAPSF